MLLIQDMVKEMFDIVFDSFIDRIALMVEVWHESAYYSECKFRIQNSEFRIIMHYALCIIHCVYYHPRSTCFPIGASDSDSDKAFANLSNKLIVSDTDMKMFLSRSLLVDA